MPHFALQYEVVAGFAERRMAHRDAHLRLVRDAHDRGVLLMAGALGDPPEAALLVFQSESAAAAEDFARADPYVREGLVTSWRVRPWHVVVGAGLTPPKAL
jgi:uncharacterized protein YciI